MKLQYIDYGTKKIETIVCQQVIFNKLEKGFASVFMNENDSLQDALQIFMNDIIVITDKFSNS